MFPDVDMHIAHVVAFHKIQRITETDGIDSKA